MCGLAGLILKPRTRKAEEWKILGNAFNSAFTTATLRGRQASGIAIINKDKTYNHLKSNQPGTDLMQTEEYKNVLSTVSEKTTCVMGHTRFPTGGAVSDYKNNHPLRVGPIIGAHNGSIWNATELFEDKKFKRLGLVDSEILLALAEASLSKVGIFLMNRFQLGMKEVEGQVVFTFANLNEPHKIHLVNVDGPLCVAYNEDLAAYLWTSTEEAMTKATKANADMWCSLDICLDTHYYININKIGTYFYNPIETDNSATPGATWEDYQKKYSDVLM